MTQFYTYIHCKPDGTPFYVGKGSGRRSRVFGHGRTVHHNRVVKKYGMENIGVFVFHCKSEEEAFSDEIQQIAQLRSEGIDLVNLCAGGEGLSNPSQDVRKKLSDAKKGKPLKEETRKKISALHKGNKYCLGKKHKDSTKQKMSESRRGKPGFIPTDETRKKLSASHLGQKPWNKGVPSEFKGVPRSKETKEKISAFFKGKSLSEEHRAKLSNAHTGKRLSDAHKAKLSLAMKESIAKRNKTMLIKGA